MKKIIKKSVLLFCFLIFLLPAFGVLAEENSEPQTQDGLQGEQAYKMLYEEIKDTNGKILDTVYWSLTFASAFIVLFLAANWWTATRSRKKEFETLKAENDKAILEMKADLRKEIQEEFEKNERKNKEEIKNSIKELTLDMEKKIQNLEYDSLGTTDTLLDLQGKLQQMKGDLAFNNGERHVSFALSHYLNYGEIALKRKAVLKSRYGTYETGFSTPAIVEALNAVFKTLSKMDFILAVQIDHVSEFLKKIPEEHSGIVHRIQERLTTMPTESDKRP